MGNGIMKFPGTKFGAVLARRAIESMTLAEYGAYLDERTREHVELIRKFGAEHVIAAETAQFGKR